MSVSNLVLGSQHDAASGGGGSTLQGPGRHRPPNLAVLWTHRGQLILRKISKYDATECQILRLKRTKFDFCRASCARR